MVEYTQSVNSGGFRIDISPDEIRASSANRPARQLKILAIVAVVTLGYAMLIHRGSLIDCLLAIAFFAIGTLFSTDHNIQVTARGLDVIDTRLGRTRQTRLYPRDQITSVTFGAVSFSRYGGSSGLIFQTRETKVKVLYGLRAIEAQILLDSLERLGFAVRRDPGMPMAVEMEQSRRNSRLGRLLY